jgi:fungal STAND N-terminal Goodbye domain
MSSSGQSTSSPSTIQSIIDALADYAKVTGIDLSDNPFVVSIEHSNSPEAILDILHEREKAFKEYRDGDRRLITCLRPAVKVIQAFSGILGEAVNLVSNTYHLLSSFNFNELFQVPFPPASALFAGIDTLLTVRHSNTLF